MYFLYKSKKHQFTDTAVLLYLKPTFCFELLYCTYFIVISMRCRIEQCRFEIDYICLAMI